MKWTFLTRPLIILLLMTAFTGALQAQHSNKGIRFFNGDWQSTLAEARRTGKLIFVDVYTTWCGPCKRMEHEIFPLAAVGDKYNASFINYRVDAEKGEGIELKKQYNVSGYPTYLYINGNGSLIYRNISFNPDPAVFLEHANRALLRAKKEYTIEEMKEMYIQGRKDTAFLRSVITRLTALRYENDLPPVVNDYMAQFNRDELLSRDKILLLLKSTIHANCKQFDFILDNQADIAKIFREDSTLFPEFVKENPDGKLGAVLSNIVIESIVAAISTKDPSLYQNAIVRAPLIKNGSVKTPYTIFMYSIDYHKRMKDTVAVIRECRDFMDKVARYNKDYLDDLDRRVYREYMYPFLSGKEDSTKVEDFPAIKLYKAKDASRYIARALDHGAKNMIICSGSGDDWAEALKWSERSLVIAGSRPDFLQTSANLYYKMGNRKKAIKLMEKALADAQKDKQYERIVEVCQKELAEMRS